MLNWRGLDCPPAQYLVKGSELAVAFVGPQSRFAIYEVRTREADGFSGTRYDVRDASLVSDADLRDGKRSPVVFSSGDPQDCETYCAKST